MKIRFTEENRAGSLQSTDDLSVFGRNPVFEQLARRSSANARGVEVVLQCDRNAVEGSSPNPAQLLLLHLTSDRQSLFPRCSNEGIQRGVVTVNSPEARLRQIDRGCGSASKQLRSLLECQTGQILRSAKARL
jgi:hypothetical protein